MLLRDDVIVCIVLVCIFLVCDDVKVCTTIDCQQKIVFNVHGLVRLGTIWEYKLHNTGNYLTRSRNTNHFTLKDREEKNGDSNVKLSQSTIPRQEADSVGTV